MSCFIKRIRLIPLFLTILFALGSPANATDFLYVPIFSSARLDGGISNIYYTYFNEDNLSNIYEIDFFTNMCSASNSWASALASNTQSTFTYVQPNSSFDIKFIIASQDQRYNNTYAGCRFYSSTGYLLTPETDFELYPLPSSNYGFVCIDVNFNTLGFESSLGILRGVLAHEEGHVLSLQHPNQTLYWGSVLSLMYAFATDVYSATNDYTVSARPADVQSVCAAYNYQYTP
ncbi:MAG: hypothetical protein E7449_05510 [Ruminococcaceae bacterium]|nr:hypothetical protein [Oscillospiraceae bacterium]